MKKKINFEESMQELEGLVQALEAGQMSLKLKAELTALLDEGDRRIRVLTETGEREIAEESVQ